MGTKKIWNFNGKKSSKADLSETDLKKGAAAIYDSPDTILNEFANRVFEDTEKLFRGIVTESIGSNSERATYALYIVAPKLKDYMYRLIEVNVPNLLQPYPLEVTLFAKDPKNHRTFGCGNATDFRKRLLSLIESPLTSAILSHLKVLMEISQQNEYNNFQFSLSDAEPVKSFTFGPGAQPITIKRIILQSHINKTSLEWGAVLSNASFAVESNDGGRGMTSKQHFAFFQFMSLFQTQPVLELSLTLPEYSFYTKNKSNGSNLIFTLITKDKDVVFDFFYDGDEKLVVHGDVK